MNVEEQAGREQLSQCPRCRGRHVWQTVDGEVPVDQCLRWLSEKVQPPILGTLTREEERLFGECMICGTTFMSADELFAHPIHNQFAAVTAEQLAAVTAERDEAQAQVAALRRRISHRADTYEHNARLFRARTESAEAQVAALEQRLAAFQEGHDMHCEAEKEVAALQAALDKAAVRIGLLRDRMISRDMADGRIGYSGTEKPAHTLSIDEAGGWLDELRALSGGASQGDTDE